jgi:hypothetical protein
VKAVALDPFTSLLLVTLHETAVVVRGEHDVDLFHNYKRKNLTPCQQDVLTTGL